MPTQQEYSSTCTPQEENVITFFSHNTCQVLKAEKLV